VKTVILCGGMGTRAYPQTVTLPKPLMEVGGTPILHHLMRIYARQGHTEFVLAGGYKVELVQEFAAGLTEGWDVEVLDTGLHTNTAGRVLACADHVGDQFFCTYADGLGDVDLAALLAFHQSHGGRATLTCVPLPSQYGTLELDGTGRVHGFKEKPRLPDHLINAGYFVFERELLDHWPGEDLERDVLPVLSARGDLFAYRHDGFWKSMDTYKDAQDLTALTEGPSAPWEG
jgi:glucose-1-phosphate cytidylyltransferase